jgi:single-stranded-DNA-specific exonuclease
MDYINSHTFDLVLIPDAGSNDYEAHAALKKKNIDTIILDHHLADKLSDDAIVINNQLSNYPNKELSGVGVVYQFCRYIDEKMKTHFADYYLDLVALGLTGDMMSLTSIETKHLIMKGFEPENIHNPYIYEMWQKNKFKLGEHITSIDAAFYIVPMINAVQRSGEIEEKELLFKSMLKHEAFEMIPSNKRGHAPGEMERLVDQAVRMSTNVKNRQTRAQDAGLEFLEGMIEEQNLLEHKVLLFLLEPGQVDRNIAGLIANKFMAKYQRPCCILTKVTEVDETVTLLSNPPQPLQKISYQGSARGYDASGITNFKDICAAAPGVIFAEGHQGAFGLGIEANAIDSFLEATDAALANMSSEPSYFVDYIFDANNIDTDKILEIARMNDYWGKDIDRAYVCIKGLKVCDNNFQVMKSNTLKFKLSNVDIIKFGGTDEEIEKFSTQGYVEIDCVCQCCINEWPQFVYNPQLQMVDYEIVDSKSYYF